MDVDYQPLPEIWRDQSLPPDTPGPVATSSKVVAPSAGKKSRRGIPSVIIPPRPHPASPVPSPAPIKKGKPAAKARSSDVVKTIAIEEAPVADLLTVPELEGLQGSVDLAAVRILFPHFSLLFY